MKNRAGAADTFSERFGWHLGAKTPQTEWETHPFGTTFGVNFRPKNEKIRPKWHPKIDAEKVSKNDAKMMPKWCQNGCPNLWFFMLFRKRRKCPKLFVLQYKTWFWAPRNASKIDTKSMQNRCKKKACKKYGKWCQNASKMGAKIHPKSEKYRKKRYPKIDAEIWCQKNAFFFERQILDQFWIDFLAVPGGKGGGRYLKIPDWF